MTRGIRAMARTRETMGMKVKDVVGAFEFSDECAAVDVLVMTADGIKAFEVASEELEGSQYEEGYEPMFWDSEVSMMALDNGRLALTVK